MIQNPAMDFLAAETETIGGSQRGHKGGTRDETRRMDDRREGYVRRDEHYRYTKGQSGVGYANG